MKLAEVVGGYLVVRQSVFHRLSLTLPRPRLGSPGEPYTAEKTTTRGRIVGTCRDTSSARWPSCRVCHVAA